MNNYEKLMDRFKVDKLLGVTPDEFQMHITGQIGERSRHMEGYPTEEGQRTPSVEFTWGHDHDFGTFQMVGKMRDRHTRLMKAFEEADPLFLERVVTGKVLDVGCWTGGSSLLFAALKATRVDAIDEVQKYVRMVNYLASAFGMFNLTAHYASLYDLASPHHLLRTTMYDVIHCSGVLYHLTDPFMGLRIMSRCLRPGGLLLLETAVVPPYLQSGDMPAMMYMGPTLEGWNWWFPTRACVEKMLRDAGFTSIYPTNDTHNRCSWVAHKDNDKPIMRCGMTYPEVED